MIKRIEAQVHGRWVALCTWFQPHKVCELVAEQKIDVLFDLITGKNRLVVFSRRAAPVQVTWLGYPDTTGVGNMDYRIVDDVTDPSPWADELASEKLYRLPETFICYQPADDVPDVPVKSRLSEGKIVFGTFNEASKFSPSVLRLWCEILRFKPNLSLSVGLSVKKRLRSTCFRFPEVRCG